MIIKNLFNKYRDYRYLKEIRMKWLHTLVYANVTVGSEEDNTAATFDLLEMKKTPTGVSAISLVPYGLSVKQLQESKEKLQDALNSYITIEKNPFKPKIYIEIIDKEPEFKYEPVKAKENEFFIAYNLLGKPVYADLNINNNFLVAGMRGQGKTVFLIIAIVNCMINNKDIDFHFIQIKKNELSIFNACKSAKSIVNTVGDTLLLLKYIMKEIDRRAELFKRAGKGIDNIKKYNSKFKEHRLKRIFVVVEELSFFMDIEKDDRDYKDACTCWNLLKGIAKAGRSTGIGVIGVVQKTTKDNLDSGLKSQMNRITFRQESNTDSVNVIGTGEATSLRARELICTIGTRQRLIVPEVKDDYSDLIEYLPELGEEPSPTVLKQQQEFMNSLRPKEPLLKVIKKPEVRTEDKTQAKEIKPITEHSEALQEVSTTSESNIKLTKRDKEILKFTESYGAFTVNQCCSLFFKGNTSKNACRRRLNELVDAGILDVAQVGNKVNKQYFLKGGKGKTEHDLYVLDCYSKFLEVGCKVTEFKLVPRLLGGKVVPDAYFKLKYKNKTHNVFVEVDLTHITKQEKINLYENYKIKNNLDFCILILKKGKLLIESNQIDIYQTDFKLSDIASFLENF